MYINVLSHYFDRSHIDYEWINVMNAFYIDAINIDTTFDLIHLNQMFSTAYDVI